MRGLLRTRIPESLWSVRFKPGSRIVRRSSKRSPKLHQILLESCFRLRFLSIRETVLRFMNGELSRGQARSRDFSVTGILRAVMTTEQVRVTLTFDCGAGVSNDQQDPLLRPFRQSWRQRRQIGSVVHLLIEGDDVCHTLGSLVWTKSRLLLFFPGVKSRVPIWKGTSRGDSTKLEPDPGVVLEHLTLEPELDRWHVRCLQEDGRRARLTKKGGVQSRFPTRKDGSLVYWFAMQIPSVGCLQPTPKKLTVTIKDKPSRIDAILEHTRSATQYSVHHLLRLPECEVRAPEHAHIAVGFVVDRSASTCSDASQAHRRMRDQALQPCAGNPSAGLPNGSMELPVRLHPVRIAGMPYTLWVVTARLPSALQGPSIISAWGSG